MVRISATWCAAVTSFIAYNAIGAAEPAAKMTLTFVWHAGDRANLLQEIAHQYTEQTGVEIKAVCCLP